MMDNTMMGTNLQAYLEANGWEPYRKREGKPKLNGPTIGSGPHQDSIEPGMVGYFSTMGHLMQWWHKDGKWIAWGLSEHGYGPTLIGPRPGMPVERFETDGKWWATRRMTDTDSVNRWLAATPAAEVVERLFDPNYEIPIEHIKAYETH